MIKFKETTDGWEVEGLTEAIVEIILALRIPASSIDDVEPDTDSGKPVLWQAPPTEKPKPTAKKKRKRKKSEEETPPEHVADDVSLINQRIDELKAKSPELRNRAKALVQDFGADSINELHPEHYAEFLRALDTLEA